MASCGSEWSSWLPGSKLIPSQNSSSLHPWKTVLDIIVGRQLSAQVSPQDAAIGLCPPAECAAAQLP